MSRACTTVVSSLLATVAYAQDLQSFVKQAQECRAKNDCVCSAERYQDALNAADVAQRQLVGTLYLARAESLGCSEKYLQAINQAELAVQFLGTDQARKLRDDLVNKASTQVIPAGEIGRGFKPTAVGQPAQVGVWIPFEFNSDVVQGQGAAQAAELGKFLQQKVAAGGGKFRLIGHTDAIGGDAFNQALSERRAASVRAYLVKNFGLPAASILTEGRGKRELLRPGTSQEDHRVNRRVVLEEVK